MEQSIFKKKGLFILILAVIFIIFMAGCINSQVISQNATSPTSSSNSVQNFADSLPSSTSPQNVTATIDSDNSLICVIQGSFNSPGKVKVQYWSASTGPFVTAPATTNGNNFSVEIMRLRPLTQYNYQVFLESPSNTPVCQCQGTFTSGPLPPGLQNANIRLVQGTPTYDLLLLDYNCTNFNGIVAIDSDGQIVWYYQNDNQVFTLAQEDNQNLVFNELSLNVGYTMKEIKPDGLSIHTIDDILPDGTLCAPHGRWNHEMLVQPGNKVWTIGSEIRAVNINGQDVLQTGGTIEEWDIAIGTVTRLVSTFDLLDPVNDRGADSNVTGGFFWQGSNNQYAGLTQDWTHSNSLDILPGGDILMSNRHLDQIIAIKPDFSGIDWRLGGIGSDFTFPNPADRFYHQHDVKMLSNGNILLFDNGNLRPDAEGGEYSRAEELKLDFDTMQATKVWEYRNTPDLFSSAVGSVFRFDNGDTVIDFGVDSTDDNPGIFTVIEAGPTGNAVADTTISSPGKGDQYRAIPTSSLNGETKGQVSP